MPVAARAALVLTLLFLAALASIGQIDAPPAAATLRQATSASFPPNRLARALLEELVEIDTTDRSGSATRAAEAMAARLLAAGFPREDVVIVGPGGRKQNLVARLRGTGGRRPILLLAHADVVEARREDWSVDPFTLLERDGYFYGRGTTDMKDMAASLVASLIALRQEGYRPERDVIFALTADEEGGDSNGVEWLLRNRRDLVDAEFCITEGGGGQIHEGRYAVYNVQAAEKVYLSFSLEATDSGGHSSVPRRGNPIYRLARALARLEAFEFPWTLNDVTRAFFRRMATVETGEIARDMGRASQGAPDPDSIRRLSRLPYYNALLRTTCVATGIEGGHAENALPQKARAVVNCRILPGHPPADVARTLASVIDDPAVSVSALGQPDEGLSSPLLPQVFGPIERVAAAMWPGVPVVPVMETGATDGRILRREGIPSYGVGAFQDVEDDRSHGRDERIGVRQFYEEREFLYRLIRALGSGLGLQSKT